MFFPDVRVDIIKGGLKIPTSRGFLTNRNDNPTI